MFDSILAVSLFIAAVGAGLMAGVYFAFSAFVMSSLDKLGATQATDAMNAINEVILRSWFMLVFFGSTLLHAILTAVAIFDADLAGRWLLFATGLIYMCGMFLCTVIFNLPLNNRLAKTHEDDNGKAEAWPLYFKQWTRWNHVRSICSVAALALSMHYLLTFT